MTRKCRAGVARAGDRAAPDAAGRMSDPDVTCWHPSPARTRRVSTSATSRSTNRSRKRAARMTTCRRATGRRRGRWPTGARHQALLGRAGEPDQGPADRRVAHRGVAAPGGLRRAARRAPLLHDMLQQYWDTCTPRSRMTTRTCAPCCRWRGSAEVRPAGAARPLNLDGHSLVDYRVSRSVPTREEADGDSSKAETREALIAEGRIAPEDIERGFAETPKAVVPRARR
jgi:hypothetical protein